MQKSFCRKKYKISHIKILTMLVILFVAPKLYADELHFGMSVPLKGPAASVGESMKLGVELYFKKINSEGGIKGKKLVLNVLDDEFKKELAAQNMRKFAADNNIKAIIGNVGSPNVAISAPIASENKILFYAPFAGDSFLRAKPNDRYIWNMRAGFADEAKVIIKALISKGVKADKIAFFTQNDKYGEEGFSGIMEAFTELNLDPSKNLHLRYNQSNFDINLAVTVIDDHPIKPEAFVVVASSGPAAKFIDMVSFHYPNANFYAISLSSPESLIKELSYNANGVVLSQVVPYYDSKLPIVSEYKLSMDKFYKGYEPNAISFEGYLAAKSLVTALMKIDGDISRESIIDTLETMKDFDLGAGVDFSFSPTKHQALKYIWPVIIKKNKIEAIKWQDL